MRQFAERTAVNTPIQGSAADLIKVAMVAIDRRLLDAGSGCRNDPAGARRAGPRGSRRRRWTPCVALVREEMEGAAELSVPLEVAVGVGSSWAEIH